MEKLEYGNGFNKSKIATIQEYFPAAIKEVQVNGKIEKQIDFDVLQQEFSDHIINQEQERYQMTWPGKKRAQALANTPTDNTLRPCKGESKHWEATENVYIEGDNLEALKILQESYLGKIKCIYIDPPYNTGKDFVYRDNFKQDKKDYEKDSGQVDEEGNRLFQNTESNGRFHSDWLSMMYPRLRLARNLLTDDGAIIIHIDENEYPNLEKLLEEIFGESNNLGTIVWDKRNPKGEVVGVAQQHELLSLYCKDKEGFKKNEFKRLKKNAQKMLDYVSNLIKNPGSITSDVRKKYKDWISKQPFSGGEKAYTLIDENGEIFQAVSMAAPDKPETRSHRPLIHPITGKPCPVPAKGWRFPNKSMDEILERGEIIFGKDETTQPRRKYLLKENILENVPSLLYYGGNDDSLLSGLGLFFENPKPLYISEYILKTLCNSSDTILDFFSGSATTAHAVMQLNAEDNGSRKFIMIQLPEQTPEGSEARNAGYKTIADIGKERIRRAGDKIKTETGADIDYGFRVFKIDDSNMINSHQIPDAYAQDQLFQLHSNIKSGRTDEDLLFQTILALGLPLSLKISEKIQHGKRVFRVDENALIACFSDDIPEALIEEIAMEKPLKVVFKDSSFKRDDERLNVEEIFKMFSPDTDIKIL